VPERAGMVSCALDDFLGTTVTLLGEPADGDLPTELGDGHAAATPTAGVNNTQYVRSSNGCRCVRVRNLDVFSHPVGGSVSMPPQGVRSRPDASRNEARDRGTGLAAHPHGSELVSRCVFGEKAHHGYRHVNTS